MTPEQREALETISGYLDAYECSLCGGSEPGEHTEGCPVLELRQMVNAPQTLYSQFVILVAKVVDKILQSVYTVSINTSK